MTDEQKEARKISAESGNIKWIKDNCLRTMKDKEPFVFISYKSDDYKVVLDDIVYNTCKKYGLRVYFDTAFDDESDLWIKQFYKNMCSKYCKAMIAFIDDEYYSSYATLIEMMARKTHKAGGDMKFDTLFFLPINLEPITEKQDDGNTGLGTERFSNKKINKNADLELAMFNRLFKEVADRDKSLTYIYDRYDDDDLYGEETEDSIEYGEMYLNITACRELMKKVCPNANDNTGENKGFVEVIHDKLVKAGLGSVFGNVNPPTKPCMVCFKDGDTVIEEIEAEIGTKLEEPNIPTKEGFNFKSWVYNVPDAEKIWNFETDTVDSDIELHAKWEQVTPVTLNFKISFNNNGLVTSQEVKNGSKLSKPDDPLREGYRFIGWVYNESGVEKEWDFDTNTVKYDLVLHAKWEQVVPPPSGNLWTYSTKKGADASIEWDGKSKSCVVKKGSKVAPESEMFATFASPKNMKDFLLEKGVIAGDKFVKDYNCDKIPTMMNVLAGGSVSMPREIQSGRLRPVQKEKFYVRFVNENGTEEIIVDFGDKIEKPNVTNEDGYILKGWFYTDESEEEVEWNFEEDTVNSDIELRAKWEQVASPSLGNSWIYSVKGATSYIEWDGKSKSCVVKKGSKVAPESEMFATFTSPKNMKDILLEEGVIEGDTFVKDYRCDRIPTMMNVLAGGSVSMPREIQSGKLRPEDSNPSSGDSQFEYLLWNDSHSADSLTDMMHDVFDLIIAKYPGKIDAMIYSTHITAVAHKSDVDENRLPLDKKISYFRTKKEHVVNGCSYYVGTSYNSERGIEQLKKMLELCEGNADAFEIVSSPQKSTRAVKNVRSEKEGIGTLLYNQEETH